MKVVHLVAEDVMSSPLITMGRDALVVDAAKTLVEHKIDGVPIIYDDRLAGIVTKTDIIKVISGGPRLSHAMDLMKKHDVRHLLVTKDDNLVGVVTQRNIARVLGTRRKSNLPASALHTATAMTDKFATISPDEYVGKVLHLLQDVEVLAVSDGKLAGLLQRRHWPS